MSRPFVSALTAAAFAAAVFLGPNLVRATAALGTQKMVDGRVSDWIGASPLIGGQAWMSKGEFVYQDYLFDDTGAQIGGRPLNQTGRGLAITTGRYQYPTNWEVYRSNAADLFQLRISRQGGSVFFLARLNTLRRPDTTVVGIALGDAHGERRSWPLRAGIATPGTRHVLTLWGVGGTFDDTPIEQVGGRVAVSVEDNAIEASLPVSLVGTSFRVYAGTGLWDPVRRSWMVVGPNRSATAAGGGDGVHPNLFNVAFRKDEVTVDAGPRWQDENFWFEMAQARALTAANIDAYYEDVDLLARDSPFRLVTGWQQRVFESSTTIPPFEEGFLEAGLNPNPEMYPNEPFSTGRGRGCYYSANLPSCTTFVHVGRWQPYALYVPKKFDRMLVLLHGGGYPLNFTPRLGVQRDLGERLGALLVEPYGRSTINWYTDYGQLDVLEAMADAALHYEVDTNRTAIGGISMGGYGTNRLLATVPDLFAAGVLWSAAPGNPGHNLGGSKYEDPDGPGNGNPVDLEESNSNHTLLFVHGQADNAAPYSQLLPAVQRLEDLGYPYLLYSHPSWQHTTVLDVDEWSREVEFLRDKRLSVTPTRVTLATSEAWWAPQISRALVFDRANWVSDVRVRDNSKGLTSKGIVDARTWATGVAPASTISVQPGAFEGPSSGTQYLRSGRAALPPLPAPRRNQLDLKLTNVRAATLLIDEVELDSEEPITLSVDTDGAAAVDLASKLSFDRVDWIDGSGSVTMTGSYVRFHFSTSGRYRAVVSRKTSSSPSGSRLGSSSPPIVKLIERLAADRANSSTAEAISSPAAHPGSADSPQAQRSRRLHWLVGVSLALIGCASLLLIRTLQVRRAARS